MESYKWHEQEAHKNLLDAELETLKRGLGGDFKLIELKAPDHSTSLITASGMLKYGAGKEQGVYICFPAKYPYAPPRVFSINYSVDANGNNIREIQFFNKGNQYGDGRLCLFREEIWDKTQHNIGWVLRRTQEWIQYAASPTGFPKDKIVEEIPMHLPHVGQVILPRNFETPLNAKTGKLVLTQFKPNYYILEENNLATNPFSLQISRDSFTWYAFKEGVTFDKLFPATIKSLHLLGQTFIEVLQVHFNENLLSGSQSKNIAFYLPGDLMPWHFFKAHIQVIGNQYNIQLEYFISRNVEKELYLRTKDLFDIEVLKAKRVTIVGLGAIGSEVAKSLARNGVGHFNLFDNDTFEIGNSVRHAADLYYIGDKKVNVVKELILRTNPNITVNSYAVDIFYDNGHLENCLKESDICVVLTAEDSVDYFINDKLVSMYDIPFIFARVSAGGMSGAIQVVENKKSACLRCLSEQNLDTLPIPKAKPALVELAPEYGACSNPALPGSEVDTKEVALQVTRVTLQKLLSNSPSNYPGSLGNQLYWHGPTGSKSKAPFTWEVKKIIPLSNCSICNGKN